MTSNNGHAGQEREPVNITLVLEQLKAAQDLTYRAASQVLSLRIERAELEDRIASTRALLEQAEARNEHLVSDLKSLRSRKKPIHGRDAGDEHDEAR
jgi:hypothetical protein